MDIDAIMGRVVEIITVAAPTKPAGYFAGGAEATWSQPNASVSLVCDVVFAGNKPKTFTVCTTAF